MNKPWIALSLDELLHGATERVSVHSSDAKSGAFFEKLIIDGRPCFLKVVSAEDDWIMRVTGNKQWEFQVWRAGLYQRVPAIIDHAMIGMALDDSAGLPRMAMLMHDRSRDLVPPGDDPISASQHAVFIRHLALMHAANLGWQDDAVILHEFGHMVGLAHEHQNPEGGLQWNEEIVIRDLSGAPNYWDEATIRHNVLEKYSADQIRGTKFDPNSIMLYAFPDNWTKNPGGTHENTKISTMDKDFIRSAEMYPGRGTPTVQATEVPIMRGTAGKIGKPGEENLFSFQVERAGRFLIETTGSADLFMTLFGPNSTTQKLAEDDDSGVDTNPQIAASLQPGRYYARVRHYNPSQTGSYEIRVIALS